MDLLRCSKCHQLKLATSFCVISNRPRGREYHCKDCKHDRQKDYRLRAKEKIAAYLKGYRSGHKEEAAAYMKAYRQKNGDRLNARARERRRESPEAAASAVANTRRWKHNHPERAAALNSARRRRQRAARVGVEGDLTVGAWAKVKRAFDHTCLWCGAKEPEIVLSMDHIVPLSMGGRHSAENIQPLCVSCNSRKGVQTLDFRVPNCA